MFSWTFSSSLLFPGWNPFSSSCFHCVNSGYSSSTMLTFHVLPCPLKVHSFSFLVCGSQFLTFLYNVLLRIWRVVLFSLHAVSTLYTLLKSSDLWYSVKAKAVLKKIDSDYGILVFYCSLYLGEFFHKLLYGQEVLCFLSSGILPPNVCTSVSFHLIFGFLKKFQKIWNHF